MTEAREHFDAMCALIEAGETVAAIERYYAEDAHVFENRRLARAGRDKCARHEREQLAAQPRPPSFKLTRRAFDEASETGFIELAVRFADPEGRPLLLEEVLVQRWARGKVERERYYYEGVVDEGD